MYQHMRLRTFIAMTALVGMLACSSLSLGDEVLLTDGSRLAGKVVKMTGAGLVFDTSFAGQLTINTENITGLRTEEPMTVALTTGDRASGKLAYDEAEGQTITGTTFGDVAIETEKIAAIQPTAAADPSVAGAEGTDPASAAELEAMRTRHEAEIAAVRAETEKALAEAQERIDQLEPDWTLMLEIGFNGQTGNTERKALFGRVELNRDTDGDRFMTYFQARWAKENGERSQNEIMGGLRYEVDITERWFAYGRIDLEFDEFENLDLRAATTVGAGYYFLREDDHEFRVRGGLGYQHESFDDGTTEDQAIAELGYDYMLEITKWLRFNHSLTYYPTFDTLSDYRLEADTSLLVPLDDEKVWNLKLGMQNTHDSQPVGDAERLDTYWSINLVVNPFK